MEAMANVFKNLMRFNLEGECQPAAQPMQKSQCPRPRRVRCEAQQMMRRRASGGHVKGLGVDWGAPTYLWKFYKSMASNKLDDSNFSGDEWRGEGAIDGEDGEGRL
jgi:hypothetical protein